MCSLFYFIFLCIYLFISPLFVETIHISSSDRELVCLGRVSVITLVLWSALHNSIRLLYWPCVCNLFETFFFPPDFFFLLLLSFPLVPREERRARASACGGGSDFIGSGRARSPPSHAAQLRSARLHEPLYKELNLPNFTLFPERSQLARRGGVRGL